MKVYVEAKTCVIDGKTIPYDEFSIILEFPGYVGHKMVFKFGTNDRNNKKILSDFRDTLNFDLFERTSKDGNVYLVPSIEYEVGTKKYYLDMKLTADQFMLVRLALKK